MGRISLTRNASKRLRVHGKTTKKYHHKPPRVSANDQGSGLAEFALVLPILLVLVFGIIEFGIAFNRAQAVEAAAREGARLASLSTSNYDDVAARVDASLTGIPYDAADLTVPAFDECAGRQGEPVEVEVTLVHTVNIPLLFTNDVTLRGQAVFRCEA